MLSRRGLAGAILPVIVGIAPAAMAQTVPDPVAREAQRIEDRETQRQADREEQFRAEQATPPSGLEITTPDTETADNGQCVAIREVTVKGLTRYPPETFEEPLAALKGDCITIGAINDVLRTITNRYVGDGYVTSRAVVGPQNLASGLLEIIVVEGTLDDIRSSDDGYGNSTLGAAFANLKDKQLNLRALEQGVDQLSRLSSAEPGIDIEPGALPGTSNLLVTRKRLGRSWRPSLAIDNDGSAATGRFQATAGLDLDNPLGLADFWSAYYTRDLNNDPDIGTESLGGFVSVPYGWWTVTASAGKFTYTSVLNGNGQAFSNRGDSWNGSLTVDRMLLRDAKTKLSVSWALSMIDTENRIQGIRLLSSSYRQVNGAVSFRIQRRLPDAVLGFDLGFTRGLKILGAEAVDTGPGGATIKARRINASANYQTKTELLGVPLDYSLVLRGQAALDPVFSNGRFSLGGSSTVRGFRNDGISGRYGVFLRQQIGFPLAIVFGDNDGRRAAFSGYLGYDAGRIIPHNNDRFERGQLHAATLGLRLANRFIQGELSASAPLVSPDFVRRSDVEVAASLRLSF